MTPKPARRRTARSVLFTRAAGGLAVTAATACWLAPAPVMAQEAPSAAPTSAAETAPAPASTPEPAADSGPQMDLFSRNTLTVLGDARLVVANGEPSFVNGGLGKTRFQGNDHGGFQALPMEADVVWQPRFTSSLSANVSAAWQRGQTNDFDLIEAFMTYLPAQTGAVGFSGRAGLMWPEISLEHSTGGAWTVVNTITPSAINSWVGEEVKVAGVEGTLHLNLADQLFSVTGSVFGYNDTSGTLLSFRGWSLSDEKATGFGYFRLPPLNPFITLLQQHETRSTAEIDHRPGFYGRIEWRPPQPFGVALFYYDNEGNPQAFTPAGQWGWRTRFWNLGVNAQPLTNTTVLAQAMTGSTMMGFKSNGVTWVDTDFQSAFVMVTQKVGPVALTGRVEGFATREHGSEMPSDNSENGWAFTAAARMKLTDYVTGLVEILHVQSNRGVRVDFGLPSSFEAQTVVQVALRFKI